MICRQCGASLTSNETRCHQCGYDPQTTEPRQPAKVISFAQRRRTARKAARPRRPMNPTLWWLMVIVALSLLVPYVLPIHG